MCMTFRTQSALHVWPSGPNQLHMYDLQGPISCICMTFRAQSAVYVWPSGPNQLHMYDLQDPMSCRGIATTALVLRLQGLFRLDKYVTGTTARHSVASLYRCSTRWHDQSINQPVNQTVFVWRKAMWSVLSASHKTIVILTQLTLIIQTHELTNMLSHQTHQMSQTHWHTDALTHRHVDSPDTLIHQTHWLTMQTYWLTRHTDSVQTQRLTMQTHRLTTQTHWLTRHTISIDTFRGAATYPTSHVTWATSSWLLPDTTTSPWDTGSGSAQCEGSGRQT